MFIHLKGRQCIIRIKYAIKYNNSSLWEILESYDLTDYKYALIMASKNLKRLKLRIKYQDYVNNLSIFDFL